MIKALKTMPDGPLLIFGLSKENIKRLLAGDPILASMSDFGLPGRFMILAGDTEESIARELVDHRLLDAMPRSA